MSAPTPVSSLVHSSTLVTAGVYVMLRFHYLLFFFSEPFIKVFFIATILLAGGCACLETDFKKIVAMSTLSQLGLMLFILSVGVWLFTFMHMIIHAFFKRLLFMRTGSLIHNFLGGQDSRGFGGDSFSFGSFLCFFVRRACLMGFPFYIGFYSKDLIILGRRFGLGLAFYLVFLGGCFLTVYYRFRLLKASFLGFLKMSSQVRFFDSKLFLASVYFLFLKSWVLGSLFLPLVFFEGRVGFLGFDLLVGLVLVGAVYLFFGTLRGLYSQWLYFYSIGYLRWFRAGGSSRRVPRKGVFRWDRG